MSDKHFRRAGMDYLDHVRTGAHMRPGALSRDWRATTGRRLVLLSTTRGRRPMPTSPSAPATLSWWAANPPAPRPRSMTRRDATLLIPMRADLRSLNVAVAAAMVLGEALRQTNGFARWRAKGSFRDRHDSGGAQARGGGMVRGAAKPHHRVLRGAGAPRRRRAGRAGRRARALRAARHGSGPITMARPAAAAAWACSRAGCSKRRACIAPPSTGRSRLNSPNRFRAPTKTRASGRAAFR